VIIDELPCTAGDVCVRRIGYDDADPFARGTDDDAVRRYGHLPVSKYTPEIVREQIDGVIEQGLADGSLAVLAIADAESDEFLGSIVLFDVRGDRAEVGFWLAPWARGRGAAQHALHALGGAAAASGLAVLEARTIVDNVGSQKVLQAAGFAQVGEPASSTAPSGDRVLSLLFERRSM